MKVRAIITGLALVALTAPAPAQANFLEFLFGRHPQPRGYYQPYSQAPFYRDRLDRAAIAREEARRKVRAQARQAAAAEARRREQERNAEFIKALGELQRQRPGAIEVFLNDPTLRKGDIVATRTGLAVYQGSRREARPSDFVAIASVRNLPHRNTLLALQASSFSRSSVARAAPAEQPRELTIRPRRKGEPAAEVATATPAVRVIPVRATITR